MVALGLFLVLVLTLVAFGLPVGSSLALLWEGAAGDKFGIARTLVKATPLILTSLAIVVSWRAGMYNIGGEGQFIIGNVCGAAAAKLCWHLPGPLLNLVILLAAIVGGAVYAGIAGLLEVYRGVQCVISTILLNFISVEVLSWAVSGPLRRPGTTMPESTPLPQSAMFLRLDPQSDLHMGVLYALLSALLIYVFLYLTPAGFKLRLVGESASAARANRISSRRVQMSAMLISGGLAGLAGAIQYAGIAGSIGIDTGQNWGFLAIPVALLGGLHPVGVVFSSVYFGALFAGSDNLARFTPSGSMIVYVIQAVAVLAFIGFKTLIDRRKLRPSEVSA
ncbi:MAG TPA: ABC transporter permease [Fimbriimonadaceae bacterium]